VRLATCTSRPAPRDLHLATCTRDLHLATCTSRRAPRDVHLAPRTIGRTLAPPHRRTVAPM